MIVPTPGPGLVVVRASWVMALNVAFTDLAALIVTSQVVGVGTASQPVQATEAAERSFWAAVRVIVAPWL